MMSMTRAELDDAIASLVEQKTRRLPLTHKDMSEWLFGSNCHAASVNAACLRLIEQKRIDRDGLGVSGDPFTYRPYREPIDRRI
ncbi:hypothetical protein IYY11_02370 [Methylocystis sp. H62]|nr:hypothetical protein [Methylocystis sp. H62]